VGEISPKEKILLYIKSGRRCAMPVCKRDLIEKTPDGKETHISEAAHIHPFSDNGPRSSSNNDPTTRNSNQNAILVCANCHTIIDKDPQTYTAEKLLKIKLEHEKSVMESYMNTQNITFSELDNILKYLTSEQIKIRDSYDVIPHKEKIEKNNLSNQVANFITHGTIGAKEVTKYLENHPDIDFGNRIRERFVDEYYTLRHDENLLNDDLFWRLLDFASLNSNDDKIRIAGLSVLTYLFEKCDVFEK